MHKKPFNKNKPSKYWYISINDKFYSGISGKNIVDKQHDAFQFFNEERAKEAFNEISRRYSVVGAKVELQFYERLQHKDRPQHTGPIVEKKPVINKNKKAE